MASALRQRQALTWLLLALGLACAPEPAAENPDGPPNVVVVLVDDLGWKDLGCYGSSLYETPHIDALAARGIRFTNAYAAHPMCVASRYALMTGKYNARSAGSDIVLPHSETTLAETFQANGYKTFFAGKWHLGKRAGWPEKHGFDINVAGHKKGGAASHFFPYGEVGDPKRVPGLAEGGFEGEYLADRLTDEALAFIEEHQSEPFFVYLSHYGVHKPLEAKPDVVEYYQERLATVDLPETRDAPLWGVYQHLVQDNPVYAAMVASIDDSVGRVVATLERLNLADNTIVLFTSDNGGVACQLQPGPSTTSNAPLRGGKYWLYEGGIRVPLIVAHPGRIEPGGLSDAVVTGTDHYPTLVDWAGLEAPAEQTLDGVSYAAVCADQDPFEREPAFWHFPVNGKLRASAGTVPGSAIRRGPHKLIEWYETGTVELFDLSQDPGETHDLSSAEPELAQDLLAQLQGWKKKVGAPLSARPGERD